MKTFVNDGVSVKTGYSNSTTYWTGPYQPLSNGAALNPNGLFPSTSLTQYPAGPVSSGSITITPIGTGTLRQIKYSVMNLTSKSTPISVFFCGRMLTFGILGTDVECAYTGNKLVFEPGLISDTGPRRITVSVEYKDEIHHYNIESFYGTPVHCENSSILSSTLVSVVKKDG